MFTKTQIIIMEVFASKITEKFSIKQISEIIKKPYPLVHRSIKDLIDNNFLLKDNKGFLELNYKENHQELVYIESLRKKNILEKDKAVSLFVKDALNSLKEDFFVFLIFGSFVESKNNRDIDIILIINDKERINQTEKLINNIASNFTFKTDIKVVSIESAYEMLSKRDKINILNESLNKHVIIFGTENFYRILKNARWKEN